MQPINITYADWNNLWPDSDKDERLRRDELSRLLDLMDLEHGPPSKSAKAWASRVLTRARSL